MSDSKRAHESDNESRKKKRDKASKQRFRKAYNNIWPCLVASGKGEHYVHCKLCRKDFSCSHGGQDDCRKHINSLYHKNIVSRASSSNSMASYLVRSEKNNQTKLQQQIIAAEVMMCEMIAELNLSLATADSLTQCFQKMFPDSEIAKGMRFFFVLSLYHTINNNSRQGRRYIGLLCYINTKLLF